jgi:L-ascorbate metabolism protein UlaG (beta-lactamase superfamily)
MKIKWYGHAAFKITTESGVTVIIDPYQSGAFGGALSYGKISEPADIVLSSHDHDDHNYRDDIKGTYKYFNKEGNYNEMGIKIEAIPCYHDPAKGKERGNNLIFVIEADGLRLAHMGDLGHTLSDDLIKKMGKIDVILVPVGGFYTIDADEAGKVVKDLNPRITIPMHFKTPKCEFPIGGVELFTSGKKRVTVVNEHEIEVTKDGLPEDGEILVMKYAL